mmetsp:Transcript_49880/g.131258  ORF Transcript_49880/g.131258 Transcript_49880/m.131258 type:complete len:285 (+) Transcript_49880:459-1313(+)
MSEHLSHTMQQLVTQLDPSLQTVHLRNHLQAALQAATTHRRTFQPGCQDLRCLLQHAPHLLSPQSLGHGPAPAGHHLPCVASAACLCPVPHERTPLRRLESCQRTADERVYVDCQEATSCPHQQTRIPPAAERRNEVLLPCRGHAVTGLRRLLEGQAVQCQTRPMAPARKFQHILEKYLQQPPLMYHPLRFALAFPFFELPAPVDSRVKAWVLGAHTRLPREKHRRNIEKDGRPETYSTVEAASCPPSKEEVLVCSIHSFPTSAAPPIGTKLPAGRDKHSLAAE